MGEQLVALSYFLSHFITLLRESAARACGEIDKNKKESLCNITIAFLFILVYNKYIK